MFILVFKIIKKIIILSYCVKKIVFRLIFKKFCLRGAGWGEIKQYADEGLKAKPRGGGT